MDHADLSLEEIEDMNIAATNRVATRISEFDYRLGLPHQDLQLFFETLTGHSILDAGCGFGRYVSTFTELGLDYLGVDYSEGMLAEARIRNPDAEFVQSNFRTLSNSDCSFHGIWSCCAVNEQPKSLMLATLEEFKRVLKPGGCVVFVLVDNATSYEHFSECDYPYEGTLFTAMWTFEEFGSLVEAAGFRVVNAIRRPDCNSMTFVLKR